MISKNKSNNIVIRTLKDYKLFIPLRYTGYL